MHYHYYRSIIFDRISRIMANIAASARNLAQLVLIKGNRIATNHKKKIILALALLMLAYAVKKLTFGHLFKFVDAFSKIIKFFQLQVPKLRSIAEYSHPQYSVPKAIFECMNVKQFQKRIKQRQNCFEQLKQDHLTGAILTLALYNVNSFYFLIQNKYSQDFLELNASTQFDLAMYEIRKKFIEEVPNIFTKIKQLLLEDISKIQITQILTIQDITKMFQSMLDKVLNAKFDVSQQQVSSSINTVSKQAKNRFVSPYQYMVQQKPILSKAGRTLFKIIGRILSYEDNFPSPKIQITNERFQFVKYAYILPLKKAVLDASTKIQQRQGWPNNQSKELFNLVMQELQFGLSSLNFSVMLKSYANYNLKILRNSIKKQMIIHNQAGISVKELLIELQNILNENFFKQNQSQLRNLYHDAEIKKATNMVATQQAQEAQQSHTLIIFTEIQPISQEEQILEQVYMKNSFQFLQKQFCMKLFNQRSGIIFSPNRSGRSQAEEIQKLLEMMGASKALNQTQ